MATVRQKKLAKAIVENLKAKKPKNKKELLVSVGYAPSTAEVKQNEIMKQFGVSEELRALGFHEDGAKAVVESILYNPLVAPADRLKASDQVFKVQGTYAPEKKIELHAYLIEEEDRKRIDNILEDNG